MIEIPEVIRRKAAAEGVTAWLAEVPGLIEALAQQWGLEIGEPYRHGTVGIAVRAVRADGTPAVLKVRMPVDALGSEHETTALRLAGGNGCAALLEHDEAADAILLERLGPALADLGLPIGRRHEILCETGLRLWRPVPDAALPTGAFKARWLADHVPQWWEELDRPCPERVVEHALQVADRREAAHDDERAVLVHGDLHQWNTLQDNGSPEVFKLVDPDGLRADPEYDLGIVMREDPEDLLTAADPAARARRLAGLTGLDPVRIWEWGVLERVSTGLLSVRDDLRPSGDQMLQVADRIVAGGIAP